MVTTYGIGRLESEKTVWLMSVKKCGTLTTSENIAQAKTWKTRAGALEFLSTNNEALPNFGVFQIRDI
jgi:hypothetical protein